MRSPQNRHDGHYDATTIWLHWITVGLIAALWVLGETADWAPRGPVRTGLWSVHVVFGVVTGFALITRVAWRAQFGRVLPPADSGVLYALAKVTHYALYVLLGLVVATGIVNASYRGFNLFGVWSVPQFGTGDAVTRRSINGWHELAANLTMLIGLLHAMAALIHQYIWRDHLLNRMMP